jgi:hypothetical protein
MDGVLRGKLWEKKKRRARQLGLGMQNKLRTEGMGRNEDAEAQLISLFQGLSS